MSLKLVVGLLIGTACCFVSAEPIKPYIRVSGGASILNAGDMHWDGDKYGSLDYHTGRVLGFAAGAQMGSIRAELEYSHQKNEINECKYTDGSKEDMISSALTVQKLMVNGYYDFKNSSNFTPYLMAGAGLAREKFNSGNWDERLSETLPALQAGAGLSYAITENISIDTEYRYLVTVGNIDGQPWDNGQDRLGGASGHILQMGARYTFN